MPKNKKQSQTTKQTPRQKASVKKTSKKTTSTVGKATKKTTHRKPAQKKTPKQSKTPSFHEEINRFVQHIESFTKALESTMTTMSDLFDKSVTSMDTFLNSKRVSREKKNKSVILRIKPVDLHQFEKKLKALSSSSLAVTNIPQIFFCDLVHKYDAYLGRLLRVAFFVKPELLSASEKKITFADLAGFKSIGAARESIIEKEVESVIRDSHIDQFKWISNRFNLPLHKNLDVWPSFVEITERRNLFVHCDGIVSSQYIKVCKQQGVELEANVKIGSQLQCDQAYFRKAFDIIFEIGIKLGHVLWRKLQPADIKNADNALHHTGYDLLTEERYELSKILLHFATDIFKKTSSDQVRRMNLINLCIAYKFSGDKQKCNALLDSEDWTACGPNFRMAVAVLKDKYTDAVEIMKSIGTKGEVSRENYSIWPLFKKFRTSKEFLTAYHDLFGEEFILPEDTGIYGKEANKAILATQKLQD